MPLDNGKMRILDAGCGSGSLAIELKKKYPSLELYGIDADAKILSLAWTKMRKEKINFILQPAFVQKLPFPDHYFDVVYSSLVFHHLKTAVKEEALQEIHRVLKKKGSFYLFDFGKPSHKLFSFLSWSSVIFEDGRDNYKGRIPTMMKEAGFTSIQNRGEWRYNIHFLQARK